MKFSEIFHFRGEDTVVSELLEGPVEDLGVIFDRSRFTCSVRIKQITKTEKIKYGPGVYFIKPLKTMVSVDDSMVDVGDIFKIVGTEECEFNAVNLLAHFLEISLVSR